MPILCADAFGIDSFTSYVHKRLPSFGVAKRQSKLRTQSTTDCPNVNDIICLRWFETRLPPHNGHLCSTRVAAREKEDKTPQRCAWCQGDSPCVSCCARSASRLRRHQKDRANLWTLPPPTVATTSIQPTNEHERTIMHQTRMQVCPNPGGSQRQFFD